MKRILLFIEYDGTAYVGWQRQLNGVSVQQRVEEALAEACGHPVSATGASRTDAGVHALRQGVHFDTGCTIPPERFPFVLNNLLPPDIRVHEAKEVPPDFHARFMSSGKRYTYRILNNRHGSALKRNTYMHIPVPLDTALMRMAVPDLNGTHDFAAFQASGGTARTTVRTIRMAELSVLDEDIVLTIEGNAFLYNMVRIIAGTLVEIGLHKRDPDAFVRAFESGNRLDLGITAPACGLELTEVMYTEAALTEPRSVKWHN